MLSILRKKGPPTAEEVAIRAIVLRHVVVYALTSPPREMLTEMMKSWAPVDIARFRSEAQARRNEHWESLGSFRRHLSPRERAFADTTMVSMSAHQQADASWRVEAFRVLLWALGLLRELPPYDESADHDLVKSFPPADVQSFISGAVLRPSERIHEARDTAELWHWRSRTRELIEAGTRLPKDLQTKEAGFRSYDDIVRFTARNAAAEGTLSGITEEDFTVNGKPYRDLAREEWSEVRSITVERHFSLNWLCGSAPSNRWDDTPTDT
jgi:hypothetical protein